VFLTHFSTQDTTTSLLGIVLKLDMLSLPAACGSHLGMKMKELLSHGFLNKPWLVFFVTE
jgi:hypothetical protein